MGTGAPIHEREFGFKALYDAIYAIENDIKNELNNTTFDQKVYMTFGLISQSLFDKYEFLLKDNFDENEAKDQIFEYKYIIKKNKEIDLTHIF